MRGTGKHNAKVSYDGRAPEVACVLISLLKHLSSGSLYITGSAHMSCASQWP